MKGWSRSGRWRRSRRRSGAGRARVRDDRPAGGAGRGATARAAGGGRGTAAVSGGRGRAGRRVGRHDPAGDPSGAIEVAGYVGARPRVKRSEVDAWIARGQRPAPLLSAARASRPGLRPRPRRRVLGDALDNLGERARLAHRAVSGRAEADGADAGGHRALAGRPDCGRRRAGGRPAGMRPSSKKSPDSALWREFRADGATGTRTPDLLGAIQALSQLSYSPEQSGRNREPAVQGRIVAGWHGTQVRASRLDWRSQPQPT